MKIRIPNPFVRRVPVRYWHAEATISKRHKNFIETKQAYFDAATEKAAGVGLRKIILSENAKIIRAQGVKIHTDYYTIPFWAAAFWFPWLTQKYMEKKGYIRASKRD